MTYKTEQESFWAGEFGNEYIKRNCDSKTLAGKIALFSDVLAKTHKIENVIEFGANIGFNLQAIKTLLPDIHVSAIEINKNAVTELKKMQYIEVFQQSILDFSSEKKWDLTFTAGVLIHINPEMLSIVYDLLYKHSNRYIMICEYYNPKPVEIDYRGNAGKLFKRDFAGELMDRFPNLKLVDYKFKYHRDNVFPRDDVTWFLLKK